MVELVAHMAVEGYALPSEPPDRTFKRPAWMSSGDTEPGAAPDPARDIGLGPS